MNNEERMRYALQEIVNTDFASHLDDREPKTKEEILEVIMAAAVAITKIRSIANKALRTTHE